MYRYTGVQLKDKLMKNDRIGKHSATTNLTQRIISF